MIDAIIFRTENQRKRIMLELMARSCMRVGEVLKLAPKDIEGRKIIIRNPKRCQDIPDNLCRCQIDCHKGGEIVGADIRRMIFEETQPHMLPDQKPHWKSFLKYCFARQPFDHSNVSRKN